VAPAPPSQPAAAEERITWVRHPADAARLVLAAVVWLLVGGLALVYPEDARGLSTRVVLLVDGLPDSVAMAVVGLVQAAAVLAPLAALVLVRRGRWRELGLAVAAAAATALLGSLLSGSLADGVPSAIIAEGERPSWITGSAFPSGAYLAGAAAAATVLASAVPRSWRRTIWAAVAVVAVARVITAVETPIGLVSAVAAGTFVGSLVMLAARAPLRWPPGEAIVGALQRAGVPAASAAPTASRHRHGPTYEVTGDEGGRLFVKLVGRDERDAELLTRAVRALRVNSPSDRPALSPVDTIRHEALNLVLAARTGASVPALVAVAPSDEHGALLVMEHVEGRRLDQLDDVPDVVAQAAFQQLAALHAGRIAHGWASLHHLLVTPDGEVTLLDLRWATVSATELQLAKDLAELLAAMAGAIGVERTVTAARASFTAAELAAALPMVQPLAVAPETRAVARRDKQLLPSLRAAVQEAAGVAEYEMAKLDRLSLRKVVVFVATLVMANLLLSLLGNAGEIGEAVRQADLTYLPLLAIVPLLGFPAGAVSLMGAVQVRLALLRTTELMFAQSFLNRFTPANAGGMALRTRFLQSNGVPLVNAASSVAITSAASGVMQMTMAATFFAWAGRSSDAVSFSLPSGQVVAVVVVVLLALVGVGMATAFGRKLLRELRVNLLSILRDLRALGSQPTKLLMLFGGALAGKLAAIVTFVLTMQAFGVSLDFAVVGAMYITATTVASASPTPGGVGAIEAALTAGLTGLGEDPGQAAAIVLVFRLFSYWLPILPCWLLLTRMQRSGEA
jgi:undecaprenyl-diphosphatase